MRRTIKDYCQSVSDSFINTINMKFDFESNEIEEKGKKIIQKYLPLEFLNFKQISEEELVELVTQKIFRYHNGYYYNDETGMYFEAKKLIIKKEKIKGLNIFSISELYSDIYSLKTSLCFKRIEELKKADEKYRGKIQLMLLNRKLN